VFHRTGTRAFEQREVSSGGDKPALQHGRRSSSASGSNNRSRTAERHCVAGTQLDKKKRPKGGLAVFKWSNRRKFFDAVKLNPKD
jgi:hypothetical protein